MVTEGFTSYSVDNDKKFNRALKEAASLVKNLRPALMDIARDFYKSERAIFNLKGPGQYPPISERYGEKKKDEVGFVYPLLLRTGILMDSVTGPDNFGSIFKIVNNNTLIIGTSIPYGVTHQYGDPSRNIPERKFLFIGPEASRYAVGETQGRLQRWLQILENHIDAATEEIGEKE